MRFPEMHCGTKSGCWGNQKRLFPEIARLDRGSRAEARPKIACLTPKHQAGCGLDTSEAMEGRASPLGQVGHKLWLTERMYLCGVPAQP